ncbi:MAG: GNAT family N-acetyltransferase [Clostridiales bacterium]|nr:GNAT family N-acetyltransferase [Clostridiales bacterium]
MNIVDFDLCHVAEAVCIAKKQFGSASAAKGLPAVDVPDMTELANGLGVAAVDEGRLVGYLCAYGPFRGMFGTWGTRDESRFVGVFSPVEAHGVDSGDSVRVWQRMYQAAAEKWVRAGAAYHAIALYEHDASAKEAFFRYGFGQRCADAIRKVEPLNARPVPGVAYRELPPGSAEMVRELRRGLDIHLCQSPCFMARTDEGRQSWLEQVKHRDSRLFAAMSGDAPIAFIEVMDEGENFITSYPAMLSICGAYCLPAWRGTGVSKALLDHVLCALQAEGVELLGVDYETMNPTAAGFWGKYFMPYTASLVRRVDCVE